MGDYGDEINGKGHKLTVSCGKKQLSSKKQISFIFFSFFFLEWTPECLLVIYISVSYSLSLSLIYFLINSIYNLQSCSKVNRNDGIHPITFNPTGWDLYSLEEKKQGDCCNLCLFRHEPKKWTGTQDYSKSFSLPSMLVREPPRIRNPKSHQFSEEVNVLSCLVINADECKSLEFPNANIRNLCVSFEFWVNLN